MSKRLVDDELLRQAIEALASAYVSSTVITELRTALEQPAVEPEKTNAKESNADVDFCSNAAINEQRRNMVGEVEVGQSLGNGQHQSTGNSEPQGAVAVITGFDEYGPLLVWHTHWTKVPIGTEFYTAPQAQQPRKAVKLSINELHEILSSNNWQDDQWDYERAIEAAVLKKNGLTK